MVVVSFCFALFLRCSPCFPRSPAPSPMFENPSTSPPRTPDDHRTRPKSATPSSDGSSIIEDVSFYYTVEGNELVRRSKGESAQSNYSSPPTPQESGLDPDPTRPKPPSPDFQASPLTKHPLTRSESAFPILNGGGTTSSTTVSSAEKPSTRGFKRSSSGPVNTAPSYTAPTASSLSKPLSTKAQRMPRRTTPDDPRDRQDSLGASKRRLTPDVLPPPYSLQDEKENISESDEHGFLRPASASTAGVSRTRVSPPPASRSLGSNSSRIAAVRAAHSTNGASSRPLVDVPVPQRHATSTRTTQPVSIRRLAKSATASTYTPAPAANFDRISEAEHSESEGVGTRYSPPPRTTGGETDNEDDVPVPSVALAAYTSLGRTSRGQSTLVVNVNAAAATPASTPALSGSTRPRRSASVSDVLSAFLRPATAFAFTKSTCNSERRVSTAGATAVHRRSLAAGDEPG